MPDGLVILAALVVLVGLEPVARKQRRKMELPPVQASVVGAVAFYTVPCRQPGPLSGG